MVILGLSDGAEPGAALIVDDGPPTVASGEPWSAAERVLHGSGLAATDVDAVALAGRFTPPFAARRRGAEPPADPFSAGARASLRWARVLRGTGFGAVDADRATEWLEGQLAQRGYQARRVVLVDAHRCLASAAYRCQPSDEVLIAVVMPRGDGAFATVHRARAGLIDRLWLEAGASAVHLWLDRVRAACGLPLHPGSLVLAGGGEPDSELAERLRETFGVEGGRFEGRRLEVRSGSPWSELARRDRAVAAATALQVFRQAALEWLARQVDRFGGSELALGGVLAADPRLVARAADLPGIDRVWAGPFTGGAALAAGAALSVAGSPPALFTPRTPELPLGADLELRPLDPGRMLEVLAGGGAVARYLGPSPATPEGAGARSVLARADRAEAVQRARAALGRDPGEQVAVLAPAGGLRVEAAEALAGPLVHGAAAPRVDDPQVAGVPSADGRVRVGWADPGLAEVLAALRERTGCGAVAVLPLGLADQPAASDTSGAVEVWRRSGLPLLQLGPGMAEVGS